jgi:D-aspartate ligase
MCPSIADQVQVSVPLTRQDMPPALAVGCGVTLAAVLRLLHQADIPAYSVCTSSGDFSRYSRWYRPLPGLCSTPTPSELPQLLESLSIESAVLFPCSDDWLSATAELPERLARRFPSSVAALSDVETMVNKWRFAQLLRRERLPHPKTSLLVSHAQMASLPDEAFAGAILKPLSSAEFAATYGVKGFIVNNRVEALRAMQRVEFPIMLQEFIPGPPTAGYFVEGFINRDGCTCALFARRRLHMYPPRLGNTTLMVSVPLEEVAGAVASLQRLLQALAYRGIFSAEFKYDERDGFFKLLEINARPWWYVEAPARAGMDVCRMAYRDALHLPVEPLTGYVSGQYLGFLPNDFRAWRAQRHVGGRKFWSWLRSWRNVGSTPFHWDDPLPALAFAWRQLSNRVAHKKRRAQPILRRAVPATAAEVIAEPRELVAHR